MANYYHEARAHVKRLKEMQEDNKRRAERRAELTGDQPEYPINVIAVEGRACKMHKNAEQYQAVERMEGMIPWNGQQDNLIDRFDGRALLDFYRDPSAAARERSKSSEERRLDRLLAFESFRDLVRLDAKGMPDDQGLLLVQKESIEARAALRAAAAAAAAQHHQGQRQQPQAAPAGQGMYGAVGFAYGGDDMLAGSSSGEDSSDDDDEELATNEDLAEDAEDDRLDDIADKYGVQDFAYLLHKFSKQEGEEDELRRKRPRRKFSRKKAAERARRMAGQGLGPLLQPKEKLRDLKPAPTPHDDRHPPWRDYRDDSRYSSRRRSRSRSRSRSPHRGRDRPRTEYITEFTIRAPSTSTSYPRSHDSAPEASSSRAGGSILEALPDRPDPAIGGGAVALPAEGAKVQGLKVADTWLRRDYDRGRDRDYDRGRDRGRDSDRGKAASKDKVLASTPNAPPAKETPQERLKRIMQTQLTKQLKKDSVTQTQKKVQAEKDRQARLQIERAAIPRRSPSPRRSRSRSPTPPWRRRRSRSPRY